MKISKLYIDEYKHLKDLDFDFTYPMDFHDETKRGKPLDKICFIGQSGTGKTNILDILNNELFKVSDENSNKLDKNFSSLKCKTNIVINQHKSIVVENDKNTLNQKKSNLNDTFSNCFTKSFYLKSNLISNKNLEIFNQHPLDLDEKFKDKFIYYVFLKDSKVNIYDDNVDSLKWVSLLQEYINYNKKFTQKMSELTSKIIQTGASKFEKEFEEWKMENPRILEKFANFFNPILNNLNLEVDLINTEYPIPLKDKRTDSIIPIKDSSTGTKGLLLSFLPLFNTNTKDSIILIDEPERSLYPDMQMDLMDYYQNLAPEAQFIIATHSPFIAASFEPCERFILYFDEDGKVAVRQGTSPIGDDPNDLLSNDFKIDYINKFGHQKFQEYIDLKQKVYFEKDEKRKEEYLEKLEKLGDQYNF
ncbi:AAA family ATPase [Flavobacterium columnare]|uniref:AAA family ATPase n=1 Tax=Flavobacterium columnare TaxID=996 RepID=UPI003C305056